VKIQRLGAAITFYLSSETSFRPDTKPAQKAGVMRRPHLAQRFLSHTIDSLPDKKRFEAAPGMLCQADICAPDQVIPATIFHLSIGGRPLFGPQEIPRNF